jgi:hypothetical protein
MNFINDFEDFHKYNNSPTKQDIDKDSMKKFAMNLEVFMEVREDFMIIPPEIMGKKSDNFDKASKKVKKFIKKLRRGEKDKIFKDDDDWSNYNMIR